MVAELDDVVPTELTPVLVDELVFGAALLVVDVMLLEAADGVLLEGLITSFVFLPLPQATMVVVIAASSTDLTIIVFAENIYNPRVVVFVLAITTRYKNNKPNCFERLTKRLASTDYQLKILDVLRVQNTSLIVRIMFLRISLGQTQTCWDLTLLSYCYIWMLFNHYPNCD